MHLSGWETVRKDSSQLSVATSPKKGNPQAAVDLKNAPEFGLTMIEVPGGVAPKEIEVNR